MEGVSYKLVGSRRANRSKGVEELELLLLASGLRCGSCLRKKQCSLNNRSYVGTLTVSFQLSGRATGASLRPIADMFLEHILGPKSIEHIGF